MKLIRALQQANKNAVIIITSLWSSDPVRNGLIQDVVKETGVIFADLRPLAKDPKNSAKAEGNFTHSGVNWHPGNRGMNEIAHTIWKAALSGRKAK